MLPFKETNYITFECQTFDASGVGCDEIVMVDHLKKKKYWPGDPRKISDHLEPFLHYLHLLVHHLRSIHLSQYV